MHKQPSQIFFAEKSAILASYLVSSDMYHKFKQLK